MLRYETEPTKSKRSYRPSGKNSGQRACRWKPESSTKAKCGPRWAVSIRGYCVHKDYDVYEVDTYREQTLKMAGVYLGAIGVTVAGGVLAGPAALLGLLGYNIVQSFRAIDERTDRTEDERLTSTSSLFKCSHIQK